MQTCYNLKGNSLLCIIQILSIKLDGTCMAVRYRVLVWLLVVATMSSSKQAGCLGLSSWVPLMLSILTASTMSGLSSGLAWTHRSAIWMHLIISDSLLCSSTLRELSMSCLQFPSSQSRQACSKSRSFGLITLKAGGTVTQQNCSFIQEITHVSHQIVWSFVSTETSRNFPSTYYLQNQDSKAKNIRLHWDATPMEALRRHVTTGKEK